MTTVFSIDCLLYRLLLMTVFFFEHQQLYVPIFTQNPVESSNLIGSRCQCMNVSGGICRKGNTWDKEMPKKVWSMLFSLAIYRVEHQNLHLGTHKIMGNYGKSKISDLSDRFMARIMGNNVWQRFNKAHRTTEWITKFLASYGSCGIPITSAIDFEHPCTARPPPAASKSPHVSATRENKARIGNHGNHGRCSWDS